MIDFGYFRCLTYGEHINLADLQGFVCSLDAFRVQEKTCLNFETNQRVQPFYLLKGKRHGTGRCFCFPDLCCISGAEDAV